MASCNKIIKIIFTMFFALGFNYVYAGSTVAYTSTGGLMRFDSNSLVQTGGATLTSVSLGQDLAFDNTGRLFGQYYDGVNKIVEYDPVTLSIINQTSSLSGVRTTGLAAISAVPTPATAWLLGSGLLGLIAVARRKAA